MLILLIFLMVIPCIKDKTNVAEIGPEATEPASKDNPWNKVGINNKNIIANKYRGKITNEKGILK